jgi:hypothetical protein
VRRGEQVGGLLLFALMVCAFVVCMGVVTVAQNEQQRQLTECEALCAPGAAVTSTNVRRWGDCFCAQPPSAECVP